MWTAEMKQQYKQDREALKAWWQGDRATPFVLKKREGGYCACYLLFDAFPANIGLMFRYLLIWLAERMPFSSHKIFFYKLAGVKIGKNVFISPGVVIDPIFPQLVELQDECVLGLYSMVLAHEYTPEESRIGKAVIGNGAVIGARATIRSGVTIGPDCTVGCNSFVNKDVPAGTMVGGVPAKTIRKKEVL